MEPNIIDKYQTNINLCFLDHLRRIRKNICDGAPKEASTWTKSKVATKVNQNLSQNRLVILGFKPTSNMSRQVHRSVLLQTQASHQIVLGFQRPYQGRGFFPNCHLMGVSHYTWRTVGGSGHGGDFSDFFRRF